MNGEDSEFEELHVSVPVGHSFEYLDFVVCAFHGARGYGMVIPVQDTELEACQGIAQADKRADSR